MPPTPPIDTSGWPTGPPHISYDEFDAQELAEMAELRERALDYVMSFRSAVPIAELVLGFGLPLILAVFLVRFARPIERGEMEGEAEMWVLVGDGPSMAFETETARTPAEAMNLYCVLAEDWAAYVWDGDDPSECYPIPVARTREHARSLMGRVEFIRKELIPIA
jgi:hypothetical protein